VKFEAFTVATITHGGEVVLQIPEAIKADMQWIIGFFVRNFTFQREYLL
jgi:hypothetical protein